MTIEDIKRIEEFLDEIKPYIYGGEITNIKMDLKYSKGIFDILEVEFQNGYDSVYVREYDTNFANMIVQYFLAVHKGEFQISDRLLDIMSSDDITIMSLGDLLYSLSIFTTKK